MSGYDLEPACMSVPRVERRGFTMDLKDKKKVKAGRKGGYNGTGKAKTRSPEHYRLAGIKSGEVRRAKKEQK